MQSNFIWNGVSKMNMNDLERNLKEVSGRDDNKQQMRAIAHWLNRIKNSDNGIYRCWNEDEVPSLTKVERMKLITLTEGDSDEKIGTVHARLTRDGEQLLDEFTHAGFFMKA